MYYKLKAIKPEKTPPKIVTLNDDWRTQGDWIDRYGRYGAVLCAQAGGGLDMQEGYYLWATAFRGQIGPNYQEKNDSIRRWIHWKESNDRRVLQAPRIGGRRQSEWDDHGEVYSWNLDGPHLYGAMKVPCGKYLVSLYFFNKDGHSGANRCRDYVIDTKIISMSTEKFERLEPPKSILEEQFLSTPEGISLRVSNFWGGVYKRFFVDVREESEVMTFRVARNYSFNTILCGIFIDPVAEMNGLDIEQPWLPARELTAWESIIESPEPLSWWTFRGLDYLLGLRDQEPGRYFTDSRRYHLPLLRPLVEWRDGRPYAPQTLPIKEKELIRTDVARSLEAIQFFEQRDQVYFSMHHYATFGWLRATAAGRKDALDIGWDNDGFREFSEQGKQRQTW